MRVALLLLISACGPLGGRSDDSGTLPKDSAATTDVQDTGGTADTAETLDTGSTTTPVTIDHCGLIEADETWAIADGTHRISCTVEVDGATLTIGGGQEILVAKGSALTVGKGDRASGLRIEGSSAAPVRLAGEVPEAASWRGLQLGSLASGVTLSGLELENGSANGTGAGLVVDGVEVAVDGLQISGAEDCGLRLSGEGRLAVGSRGLVLQGNSTWPVCTTAAQVHTLPTEDSLYTGNGEDGVYIDEGTLTQATTWVDLGVPYVLDVNLLANGTADAPAVLTLEGGVVVQATANKGILISGSKGAAGLVTQGTEASPVRFEGYGANVAGYWKGISISSYAVEASTHLEWTTIQDAGGTWDAALLVEGIAPVFQHLTISSSGSAALGMEEGASFDPTCTDLVLTTSSVPIFLTPDAAGSLPTTGLDLSGNSQDLVQITGSTALSQSATWPDLGDTPWWLDTNMLLEGSSSTPTVLEIPAGANIQVSSDKGIYVSKNGGAAALRVVGTEEATVHFYPHSAYTVGNWSGIAFYDESLDDQGLIEHADIGWAGGASMSGSIHLKDASPTLSLLSIHDGSDYGIYCSGSCAPALSEISYCDLDGADCNLESCEATGGECAP